MIGRAKLVLFSDFSVPEKHFPGIRQSFRSEWGTKKIDQHCYPAGFRRVCISQVSSSMHHFRKITKPGQLLPQGSDFFVQSLEVLPRDLSPNLCVFLFDIPKMIGLLLSNYNLLKISQDDLRPAAVESSITCRTDISGGFH